MNWPSVADLAAVATLAAAGILLIGAGIVARRRTHYTWAQAPLMLLNVAVSRVLWRTRVVGSFPFKPGEGAIIVCNHRCPFDPAIIAVPLDRIVHWMVAKEYCENPAMGWFFRVCQSIPVSRAGADTGGTKIAIRYAQQGHLVGLFPEGRINATDQLLLPGRPGAALIALKARVPVVPCYIQGSPYDGTSLGCLITPAKVRLVIGQPIDLSEYYGRETDREVLEQLTMRFLRAIAALAGQPDYQPRLAGRFYKPGMENAETSPLCE